MVSSFVGPHCGIADCSERRQDENRRSNASLVVAAPCLHKGRLHRTRAVKLALSLSSNTNDFRHEPNMNYLTNEELSLHRKDVEAVR
jgi:hypothetical protein